MDEREPASGRGKASPGQSEAAPGVNGSPIIIKALEEGDAGIAAMSKTGSVFRPAEELKYHALSHGTHYEPLCENGC